MVKPMGRAVPRLHVIKRGELKKGKMWLFRLLAVVGALVAGGIVLLCLGYNPFSVYGTLLEGALGNAIMQRETIKLAIPLVVVSLGVTLAFKMRFWNIGAEGQMCIGALAASYFAYFCTDLPRPLLIILMGVAAIVAGGLWGLLPAYFKTRFGTNETLFTLMLNYIIMFFIQFLREGPWRNPTGGASTMPRFDKNAQLPTVDFPFVGPVQMGWIVALALVVMVLVYLKHTKHGYELTVVGENPNTARYAGMPVTRIILRTMFISAGICGLAGMLQVAGTNKQMTENIAGGRGFTAISIAWLARLSPFGVLFVSFLFSVMQKGFSKVETVYHIPASMSEVLQGVILFFVLGAEFFIEYKLAFQKEEDTL